MASVNLIVYRDNTVFDSVTVTYDAVIFHAVTKYNLKVKTPENSDDTSLKENRPINFLSLRKKGYNAYFVSAYIFTMKNSDVYRTAALKWLLKFSHYERGDTEPVDAVLIKLRTPKKQFLDYQWNEKLTRIILERREVNHAMSWLSTLGGAFSALGEEFHHCAKMAGRISIKQFELALRLGDPLLVARCKLYAALSLIQRGQLSIPRDIVKNVYKQAIAQSDTRLQNMCLGIWAKLKYCYEIKKQRKRKAYINTVV